MKKKLYKDSPLNSLGGGVHDLLNYQDIKSASGQFDPVGESLFSLGEMFAKRRKFLVTLAELMLLAVSLKTGMIQLQKFN